MKNYSFKADDELEKMIEDYIDETKLGYASLFKVSVTTYIKQQQALKDLPHQAKETIEMIKKLEKLLGQKSNEYGLDEIKKPE